MEAVRACALRIGARSDAVRAGLAASGSPLAATAFERLSPWLDNYAATWRAARTSVCRRGAIEGSLAPELRPRALGCLDLRRESFAFLVGRLEAAEPAMLPHVVTGAARLPRFEDCTNDDVLRRGPWPATADWTQVAAVRRGLAEARTLSGLGHYRAAVERATPELEAARRLAWPPLVAEAQWAVGFASLRGGDTVAARPLLEEAYFAAGAAGADATAAGVAEVMANLELESSHLPQALAWIRHGQVMLERSGGDPGREASLANVAGLVHTRAARPAEAREALQHASELFRRALGPEHPDTADAISNLGTVAWLEGDDRTASDLFSRAVEARSAALGADHPSLGYTWSALGEAHRALGDLDAARIAQERTLAIWRNSLGTDHPDVGYALNNLAATDLDDGQPARAAQLYREAAAITARGQDAAALGLMLANLGEAELVAGNVEAAAETYARARLQIEESLGPDHVDVALALCGLAAVELARGSAVAALPLAERCLALREANTSTPEERGEARVLLAEAGPPAAVSALLAAAERDLAGTSPVGTAARARARLARLQARGP